MNHLQSYSSDNESDPDVNRNRKDRQADHGTNYDDVGMDISEESSDEADEGATAGTAERNQFAELKGKNGTDPSSTSRSQPPERTEPAVKTPVDKFKERRDSPSEKDKSRESSRDDRDSRDVAKQSRSNRDGRDSRDPRDSRDHKDYRSSRDRREKDHHQRSRDCDRRRYEDRRSRRSRSRSRDRRRTRSKTRSRSRSRERRRRRSRSRSRDRDRRKPHEIRKEAQQKLAALKAENPNFDQTELLKQGMEAQVAELAKQTGISLPSYYNPATMNPLKIAEQERKKKLLWGNKSKTETPPSTVATPIFQQPPTEVHNPIQQQSLADGRQANLWANTKFCNDSDGKMAEKFRRLMGVKSTAPTPTDAGSAQQNPSSSEKPDVLKNQETLFSSMERQYEMARLATHTHKGFGLGFSSQPFVPKQ